MKAQLSLSTIGVAILVLITVVVVAAIFTGRLNIFSSSLDAVSDQNIQRYCEKVNADSAGDASIVVGGSWLPRSTCENREGWDTASGSFRDDPGSSQVCCVQN